MHKKKTIKECKMFCMEEWTAQVPPTSACYRLCRTQDTACYFYPKKSCFSRNSVSFVLQHLLLLKGRVYINRLTWTVQKSGLFLLCFVLFLLCFEGCQYFSMISIQVDIIMCSVIPDYNVHDLILSYFNYFFF